MIPVTPLGPVIVSQSGYAEVTLYLENITIADMGQMFYIDLIHVNVETGVNVETAPSVMTLQLLGKKLTA